MRAAGVPIEDVTALSAMLTLPWAVKFLWAPGVDALRASGVPLRARGRLACGAGAAAADAPHLRA